MSLDILEKCRIKDAARIRFLEKWYDTINSPMHKRLWWFVMGYKFTVLGTWYNARWNKPGQQYNGMNP